MYPDYYTFSCKTLPDIHLADTAYIKPPYVHFRRQSADYILYFIHSGVLYLREGSVHYTLMPGDYLLLDPQYEHEGLQTSTCSFSYIHFSFSKDSQSLCGCHFSKEEQTALFSDNASSLFSKNGMWHHTNYTDQFQSALQYFIASYHKGAAYKSYCQFLLCEILSLLCLNTRELFFHNILSDKPMDKTIADLTQFLTLHFSEDIHSVILEERYHCNFDYLNRQYKKRTGKPIFSHLREIRIEQAKKYLATGLYTCSEVALKTGFHDVYYFSRAFKKLTDMPPSAFYQSV